jgi:ATP-binding cassette subfamily B (MDR/TAP) protein 1
MPCFALLWGNMTTTFSQGDDQIVDASRNVMFQFFGIGGGAFVAAWVMYGCWMIAGERQAIKCRKEYLKSLLAQEIGWFDQVNQS